MHVAHRGSWQWLAKLALEERIRVATEEFTDKMAVVFQGNVSDASSPPSRPVVVVVVEASSPPSRPVEASASMAVPLSR